MPRRPSSSAIDSPKPEEAPRMSAHPESPSGSPLSRELAGEEPDEPVSESEVDIPPE